MHFCVQMLFFSSSKVHGIINLDASVALQHSNIMHPLHAFEKHSSEFLGNAQQSVIRLCVMQEIQKGNKTKIMFNVDNFFLRCFAPRV